MDFLKNNKLLNWGIFALVVLVLFYFFGTRSGKAKKAGNNSVSGEISKANLTYQISQYVSFADRLETAMFGFTDDEEAIFDVFSKMRNKSDLLQLITTFGNRRPIFNFGSASLAVWINNRLDKSEIQRVNEILARNNIDYQF